MRGLCSDINKLEVARVKHDEALTKATENSLSYGLQTLAEVMHDHLTFKRECILTAFSLTPTQSLYKRIAELAQESGFSTAEVKTEESETSKINFMGETLIYTVLPFKVLFRNRTAANFYDNEIFILNLPC